MKLGIDIVDSSQEVWPGKAWIQFFTTDGAKSFLDAVANFPDEDDMYLVNDSVYVKGKPFDTTLYGRITQCGSDKDWQYHLSPFDLNGGEAMVGDQAIAMSCGPSNFELLVSIWFPITDIPLIVERLQNELSRRECSRHESELRTVEGNQQVDQEHKGGTIEVPDGSGKQAVAGGVTTLSGLSGSLPDAADGVPSQADDPGIDHALEEVEDLLSEDDSKER